MWRAGKEDEQNKGVTEMDPRKPLPISDGSAPCQRQMMHFIPYPYPPPFQDKGGYMSGKTNKGPERQRDKDKDRGGVELQIGWLTSR